jgi:hypothetical protein
MDKIGFIYGEPRPDRRVTRMKQGGAAMTDKNKIQGEGNYDAARRFDEEERKFVESGQVEEKAKAAEEALEGPEAEELERARKETGERGAMPER